MNNNYIESMSNKFGWAINDTVIDILLQTLEEEISLTEKVTQFNDDAEAKNAEFIKEMKAKATDKAAAEEYDNLKPQLINTKDKIALVNFGFESLMKDGKTLMHWIDEKWELYIKIFKLEYTKTRTLKVNYNITYE